MLFLHLCDLGSKGTPQRLLLVTALLRVVSYFAMQSVALVTEYAKGRARHIPTQTDTVVRFAPEHVVLFLRLCDLGRKERHKGYYS